MNATLEQAPRPESRAWKQGSLKADRSDQPEEPDHAHRPKPGWAGSGGIVNRGAGFTPGPTWLGYRSPATESAVPAGPGPGHCPLSGPAGNSGTTDDRSPNAGIILIKPPAQRRMGVKRRLVDQGLWFNAGVTVLHGSLAA